MTKEATEYPLKVLVNGDSADRLVELLTSEFERTVKTQLLRELAHEARTRGDIGHPEGIPAEKWLEGMADRLEATK